MLPALGGAGKVVRVRLTGENLKREKKETL